MATPTNVTPNELYSTIATLGVLQTAQLGYFHGAIPSGEGSSTLSVTVPVVAATDRPEGFPDSYGSTTLSLSNYNLTGGFTLSGNVANGVDGVVYEVEFRDIKPTSCILHVASYSTEVDVPTLNVSVSIKILT